MSGMLTQYEQHTIQIQRLATRLLNAHVYPSLTDAYKAARLILLESDEITSITQLNKITRDINKSVINTMNNGWALTTADMEELAHYEASYYANLIESTTNAVDLNIPGDEQITRYINRSLMSLTSGQAVTSGTWAQLVQANTDAMIKDYDSAVRTSYAQGETNKQAAKRIADITEGISKREADALARTGVQHYAVQAHEAIHEANERVIKGYEYVAVLDNRTSTLCGGRDGNFYKKGKKRPPLPAHFNCRSQYLAIVIGEDDLEGRRVAVGGKGGDEAADAYEKRKDRKRTTGKVKRRGRKDDTFFKPEKVNATTDYDKWLERQPDWFVESALGKTRAKLFKDGGMPISKFNDMTGRQLTIDELRELDSKAFTEAGL